MAKNTKKDAPTSDDTAVTAAKGASKKSASSKKSTSPAKTTSGKTKAQAKKPTKKKSALSAASSATSAATASADSTAKTTTSKKKPSTTTAKKSVAKKAAKKPSKAKTSPRDAALDEAVEVSKKAGHDKATKKQIKKRDAQVSDFTSALRVGPGFRLADLDASSTPGFDGGHKKAEKLMRKTAGELEDLQERLYAGQRHPDGKSVLLVVQGMDTSGKGGIMRHVVGTMDPQGVELTSFKAPTKEELEHPFLWRIRNALPKPGYVGVFDRSQYEDVLVVRVHDLVSRPVWMRRYGQINAFEESAAARGITIIKVMLHIDADEQKERLSERLENPEKHYKFNPGDLTERSYWKDYQEAYQAVLDRTSTDVAPWFVVPANHKWYARLAVQQLLLEHLRVLDLPWPEATFDVEEQKSILETL